MKRSNTPKTLLPDANSAAPGKLQAQLPELVAEQPVFILASGRRTGSTLVQRLLISSGEVLIWGEHDGVLVPNLYTLLTGMQNWLHGGVGAYAQLVTFQRQGYNAWIPNMTPPLQHFESGCRGFLRHALGGPARQLGYARWGFKEVRYGTSAALFLQHLYPDARFILLVRNPESCLRSIKATDWGERIALQKGPQHFLATWAKLGQEFIHVVPKLRHAVLLRHEDIIQGGTGVLQQLAHVANISPGKIKYDEVLAHKESGPAQEKIELDDADRLALQNAELRRVATQLGY